MPRFFETTDCTGQAWIDGVQATFGVTAFVRGVTVELTGIRTFYVPHNSDSPQVVSQRTSKNGSGDDFCRFDEAQVGAVRVTPVDLDGMFTPPFRMTTRERAPCCIFATYTWTGTALTVRPDRNKRCNRPDGPSHPKREKTP